MTAFRGYCFLDLPDNFSFLHLCFLHNIKLGDSLCSLPANPEEIGIAGRKHATGKLVDQICLRISLITILVSLVGACARVNRTS